MNVIYFHTHDTGRWIGTYGFPFETPNYTKVAESGTCFRQAFCAAPTCSPSRAALLTGQWAHSSGMLGLAHRGFSLADPAHHLAKYLSGQGYDCVLAGVEHTAHWKEWDSIGFTRKLSVGQLDLPKSDDWEVQGENHLRRDAATVDVALDFLREAHDKPFFLSLGLNATHRHFPAPGPEDPPDRMMPPPTLPDNAATRRDLASYATMVRAVDQQLGRVLEVLAEVGLEQETLLLCTTDHGPAFPGMKCSLRDSGIGVLFLLRYPGNPAAGSVSDALVSQIDFFPTLCDLLELPKPDWLQGESLLPLLEGEKDEVRDEVFAEVTFHAAFEPKRCIRTHRYKYIKRFDDFPEVVKANIDDGHSKRFLMEEAGLAERRADPPQALYDLYYDPSEMNNLIDDPDYSDIAFELRRRLREWMEATDDPLLTDPKPKPAGAKVNLQSALEATGKEFEPD